VSSAGRASGTAPAQLSTFAQADTARVVLSIDGMTCGSCVTTAQIVLRRIEGVYLARVSYDSPSAEVLYDPSKTGPDQLIERLRDMTGYEARVAMKPTAPTATP
jgi:copper chaperone CopZ